MSNNERVHIGMPVFNGEAHLADALESLFNQTHENFEIFLVDNASTDGTPEIAKMYAEKDSRLKHFRMTDWVCAIENWRRTFELASPGADFFMWASDDDFWDKRYIESLLPPLLKSEGVVLSFSQYDDIDLTGHTIGELYRDIYPRGRTPYGRINSLFRSGRFSAIYGLMKTRSIYWRPCLHDTCFPADLWFLLCMATAGRFHIVKQPLLFKRLGGISETGEDPCIVRDPSKVWNIGKNEWDLIAGLRPGYLTKLYLYYRLRLQAKSRFPVQKQLDWFLHPVFWAYVLSIDPLALGIRSRIKALLHGRRNL